jgi:hypothetical protein
MQASTELNGSDCEPPDVPAPGVTALIAVALIISRNRNRH